MMEENEQPGEDTRSEIAAMRSELQVLRKEVNNTRMVETEEFGERTNNEIAAIRSELGELRNEIKEILEMAITPDAYWGSASGGAHYRLQDDPMDRSNVSTSLMMRGRLREHMA
ncbi:expressed unknown protein [Seminavis robusta]|uniref:Uncharacterized protein n=1 Tax=Seminavis robusta TaxID=568900 RepID=A0A9N8E264_9STRA|nr:expressed unknown protein [Seminavis robusta]|eukprot:Sro577_g169730.1 n/a (114) ;mRNA; r:53404-53745